MDWMTYEKAKQLDEKMSLLKDVLNDNFNVSYDCGIYPLWTLLKGREDFKKYIEKVYDEVYDEFAKLGNSSDETTLDDGEIEKLAQEYYNENIFEPSQAVFDEMGNLVKTADVDDNGDPYLFEGDVTNAFIAGYKKALGE